MKRMFAAAAGGLLAVALCAQAQQPIVYPAKAQSNTQQKRDEGECGVWARDNTGVDPAVLASQPPPQADTAPSGQRLRGAARGAVAGTAIGAVAGDTGKGAAIGATAGVLAGGRRARNDQAQAQQQAQSANEGAMSTYFRAYGACLKGRGYSVE
jgi:hypothetical protein